MIDQFVRHRLGELPGTGGYEEGRVPDAHVKLFGQIVRQAVQKQDQIDGLLAASLPEEWPLARLDPVLRALLRAAGAELVMRDGPPVAVVINEYMDVAHGFFHGDEPKMANGLMDALAHVAAAEGVRDQAVSKEGLLSKTFVSLSPLCPASGDSVVKVFCFFFSKKKALLP